MSSKSVPRQVTVGWLLAEDISSVVFYPPERLGWPDDRARPGVAQCPAIRDFTHTFWVVRSPWSFRIRVTKLEPGASFFFKGEPCEGEVTLSDRALSVLLKAMPIATWEHPARPLLQLRLPYVFVSDASVYVEQFPAFMSDIAARFPGIVYGGRFPIDVWPRRVNFAFQWVDTTREIHVRRGEPLFYLRFQPRLRDQRVRLIEAERTPELERFMASVKDVTAYTDKTFSLFGRAAEMRPPRLLKPRRSYAARAAAEAEAAEREATRADAEEGLGQTPD